VVPGCINGGEIFLEEKNELSSWDNMIEKTAVSLVIPVFNESQTITGLINTVQNQSLQPDEIILVDGGSTDNTLELANKLAGNDHRFCILEAGRAMPGKGRNIGAAQAKSEWIAFTDAGIKLDKRWLESLVKKSQENLSVAIVYGNFSPQVNSFFEKCAAISYVQPLRPGVIRTKSIASCLLKKEVWEKTGGFPDWRATEDLVFMEKAEQLGYHIAYAPGAMVYWQLRPDLPSTYQKFVLYSQYNVWAGRQAFWHYGVARQYAFMLVALLLSVFHSVYWLLLLPVWIAARVAKRMIAHRREFGIKSLFHPGIFFMVMIITLVIDTATFSGWIKAMGTRRPPFNQPADSQLNI
jgi:glycosyltransferase involved in cell wall biosynthesis